MQVRGTRCLGGAGLAERRQHRVHVVPGAMGTLGALSKLLFSLPSSTSGRSSDFEVREAGAFAFLLHSLLRTVPHRQH